VRTGVYAGVGNPECRRGQRKSEGRLDQSHSHRKRYCGGRMPRWHGGTFRLRMHEPENRQVFRERAGAGQQRLEHAVGHSRSHCLRDEPVNGGAAGPARNGGDDGCRTHPEFSMVCSRGKPPEEVVMVSAGQTGHMPDQIPVSAADPPMALAPCALHALTLPPAARRRCSGLLPALRLTWPAMAWPRPPAGVPRGWAQGWPAVRDGFR
jgi:hypothetical protein